MPSKLLPKHVWKDAVGAKKKSRRLSIQKSTDGLFHCPVSSCDNLPYKSQRGCRKHVYQRHGWFYYFDERPDIDEVLPKQIVETSKITKAKKSQTSDMPSFLKTCTIYKSFRDWLMSPGGSSKGRVQAEQISSRVLKYFRFCCQDVCPTWDIPFSIRSDPEKTYHSIQAMFYVNVIKKQQTFLKQNKKSPRRICDD